MCGSGTTCVAAMENNRNYIGIEISPAYCDLANNRIEKHKEEMGMFYHQTEYMVMPA